MVRRHSGFTFIELMIVILIIGLLAFVAAPLSTGWVDEGAIIEARGLVNQAHGQAKSLALRNPGAALGNTVAASVKLSGGNILVCQGAPDAVGCVAGGAAVSWQTAWPSIAEANFTEIRLNNRGQILLSGSPVNSGLTFTLTARSVTDDSAYNRLR